MNATSTTMTERRYREIRAVAIRSIAEEIVRDPPETGSTDSVTAAVRRWLDEHYEDRLGSYDPSVVESVVPTDPGDVESSATTPLSGDDDRNRRELYALRAVRADLTGVPRDQAEYLRRAIVVHDALERLVGERGDRTDRRPSGVVTAFAEWVADQRDETAGERARVAFTPLQVMRIDALDVVEIEDESTDRELLRALEAWLASEHPELVDGTESRNLF